MNQILTVSFLIVLLNSSQSAFATVARSVIAPWMRLKDPISNIHMDQKGRYLAYTAPNGVGLKILNLKNQDILTATKGYVGASFFWSPDGYRVFFRELEKDADHQTKSAVFAYDIKLQKKISIDRFDDASGFLTYDPRDQKMSYLNSKGIRNHKLSFPGERYAVWQLSAKPSSGKYLAAQKGMMWILDYGVMMQKFEDDGSGIESFSISPDGNAAAWSTKAGNVYVSDAGGKARLIDKGRDPVWHPTRMEILYTGARMVGKVVVSYDLKISDLEGRQTFLTTTQHTDERWPNWDPDGKTIIYTAARTTDIYRLEFIK